MIETNTGKMGGITSLDDKGELEIEGHGSYCSNCVFSHVYKNENVTATITWQENVEELELKNDVAVE
ncbi:hypothetical protein [Paraliobacillus zengyii]|uniref:hypothetical protein n=1 Tax=Paraliobacillus zengyii TaxID=2213194 RepID=UPI000DD37A2B|nr:hypothetical protein [Paraliobacillus zengyii]